MQEYTVYSIDDQSRRLDRLGRVRLDDEDMLSLVGAEPEAGAALEEAVAEMNGSDGLLIKMKPAAGAEKFSIRKEKRARGEPGYFDALQDNLRRWYDMELAAE